MQLGRVRGRVVATMKVAGLEGVRFLIVQPLDEARQPKGRPVVAADAVHMAGPGELVYYVSSREAAEALDPRFVPVDHAICGIIDELHLAADRGGGA
jgi:ethanolamine utilization protein EutN